MTRNELFLFIHDYYSTDPDYPWMDSPTSAVFRHANNRKWFALVMEVPGNKIGREDAPTLDIMNVKSDPRLTGSFLQEEGVYPAYHMSKTHWLSIALDGTCADDTIMALLDLSYELTALKSKKIRKSTE